VIKDILMFMAEEKIALAVVKVAALGTLVILGGIIVRQLVDALKSAVYDPCDKK